MASIDEAQDATRLIKLTATVEGGYKPFTVRLVDGKHHYPLSTSTYNYCQTDETKHEVARRIAALWTMAKGIPTAELEAFAASGRTLRK